MFFNRMNKKQKLKPFSCQWLAKTLVCFPDPCIPRTGHFMATMPSNLQGIRSSIESVSAISTTVNTTPAMTSEDQNPLTCWIRMFYFVRIDFFRRKKNNMKMMVVHMVLNQSVVLLFCWFLWGQIDSKLKLGVFGGGRSVGNCKGLTSVGRNTSDHKREEDQGLVWKLETDLPSWLDQRELDHFCFWLVNCWYRMLKDDVCQGLSNIFGPLG